MCLQIQLSSAEISCSRNVNTAIKHTLIAVFFFVLAVLVRLLYLT